MQINTKHFGSTIYTKEAGADFDKKQITLNQVTSIGSATIHKGLDNQQVEKALKLLDALETLDDIARNEIIKAYNKNDRLVCEFVNEHYNDYGEETTQEIFKKLKINKQNNLLFLENLELGFIISYEEKTRGICATLDYNLIWSEGFTFTDQILAVSFNSEMECLSIAHES